MSRPSTAGNQKRSAPELGSFPLDHFKECSHIYKNYKDCLEKHKNKISPCRKISMRYLECRMDKDLMAKESMQKLGFRDVIEQDEIKKS